MTRASAHAGETHGVNLGSRLNVLRAGVLGAQDGIVSTAGLVVGVAGASSSSSALLIAGLAGLVSGALSMAGGEYVSVSTQRDTEIALLAKERWEHESMSDAELEELAGLYQQRGLSRELAHQVAVQLHEHDALAAHAQTELNLDPEMRTSPWHAAVTSAAAFAAGAVVPLVTMTTMPGMIRVPITFAVVVLALIATGYISARLGSAPRLRAAARITGVGILTMLVTYAIGALVGIWI